MMMDGIKYWAQEVFANRMTTWPAAAILYCLFVLSIRNFFLNPLFFKVQDLGKKERKEVKKTYLSRAFSGWGFFGISLLLFIFMWRMPSLYPVTLQIAGLLLAEAFFASLFITSHLQALSLALIEVLLKLTQAATPPQNDNL